MDEEEDAGGAGEAELPAELRMAGYDDDEEGGGAPGSTLPPAHRSASERSDPGAPAERMYGAGMRGEVYHENEGDPYISVPEQDVDRDSEEDEDFTLRQSDALLLVRGWGGAAALPALAVPRVGQRVTPVAAAPDRPRRWRRTFRRWKCTFSKRTRATFTVRLLSCSPPPSGSVRSRRLLC